MRDVRSVRFRPVTALLAWVFLLAAVSPLPAGAPTSAPAAADAGAPAPSAAPSAAPSTVPTDEGAAPGEGGDGAGAPTAAVVAPPARGLAHHRTFATTGSAPVVLDRRQRQVVGDGRTRYRHRGAVLRPRGRTALPPRVRMRAWVLTDADTGRVLAAKAPDAPLPVASLTKVLTALTAQRTVPARPPLPVPRWATRQTCSCAGVKAGKRYDRVDLLRGALLTSGNDAAEALAAAHPEGPRAFYDAMNRLAVRLGATRTRAGNASGLTVPGAQSTARDVHVLLDAAMADPELAAIMATRGTALMSPRRGRPTVVSQRTDYVQKYAAAAGKSGYTSAALNTLAVHTVVDGRRFGVVTLGAPGGYSTSGTRALAEWGARWYDRLRPVGTVRPRD